MPESLTPAPGRVPAPRAVVAPGLRAAILRSEIPQTKLSLAAGFMAINGLAIILGHPFACTPRTVTKLEKLAEILGHRGPVVHRLSRAEWLEYTSIAALSARYWGPR